jgi:broad specificity phosphatase PhoE
VGRATGWWPGRLSDQGRVLAARLGERRRDDGIAAVFSSDLTRAAETASVAFGTTGIPVLLDWRLRECDYRKRNGMPVAELHANRPGKPAVAARREEDRAAPREAHRSARRPRRHHFRRGP